MKKITGFTIVECIILILVLSIASIPVYRAFSVVLATQPTTHTESIAAKLAEGRMELILGQKRMYGFSTFSDPCPIAPACVMLNLTGYTTTTDISTTTMSGDTNYDIITVTTTGPNQSQAILKTLVAKY